MAASEELPRRWGTSGLLFRGWLLCVIRMDRAGGQFRASLITHSGRECYALRYPKPGTDLGSAATPCPNLAWPIGQTNLSTLK
jgi:hypothetical protein